MPRSDGACRVCSGWEPQTVDRLLLVGHGIRFVAAVGAYPPGGEGSPRPPPRRGSPEGHGRRIGPYAGGGGRT